MNLAYNKVILQKVIQNCKELDCACKTSVGFLVQIGEKILEGSFWCSLELGRYLEYLVMV